jgi:hypothetical protein
VIFHGKPLRVSLSLRLVGDAFVVVVVRARVCIGWASSWVTQAVKVLRLVMVVSRSSARSSFSVAKAAN